MSASGIPFTQAKAKSYAFYDHLIILCGHYEGIDARITEFIDEELSVGDFITTGGEIPAMLITDAVCRLIPGVLKDGVTDAESFSLSVTQISEKKLLEYPQYTKPPIYEDLAVPDVLLSGNHKKISEWRSSEALKKTKKYRPELL
jgi:tRNA (guanine37-N1)-methyltransferase